MNIPTLDSRLRFAPKNSRLMTDLCAVPQIDSDSLLLVGDSHLATLPKISSVMMGVPVESKSSLEWVKNQAREKKRIIIARYLNLHYLVVFNRK